MGDLISAVVMVAQRKPFQHSRQGIRRCALLSKLLDVSLQLHSRLCIHSLGVKWMSFNETMVNNSLVVDICTHPATTTI